jgi:hypothetical protein
MSGPRLRRRGILKWCFSAATFAPAAMRATAARSATPRSGDPLARALVDLFQHRQSAAVIGRAFLLRHPEEADARALIRRITGHRANELAGLTGARRREALRAALQSRYRHDFDQGRTRTIRGATLSLTELRLCALVAIETGS